MTIVALQFMICLEYLFIIQADRLILILYIRQPTADLKILSGVVLKFVSFFLEYAGELHIIVLRRRKKGQGPIQTNTHSTQNIQRSFEKKPDQESTRSS
jgi:hypothetical protein